MNKLLLLLLILPQVTFGMVGLKVGALAPDLAIGDTDGKSFNFSKQSKTTIAVFYRGAWCPYCMTQLKSIQDDLAGSIGTKVQIVAISVDQLRIAKKMKRNFKLSFTVLSDPKAKSLSAFKIINKLSDELVKKYKTSYKIDVEADSGETHHMVAHPAVFIIENGKIIFADINLDYKKRTPNSKILDVLKKRI
jgi:peroxiredoxin